MKVIKQNTKQLSLPEISFSKLVVQTINFYTRVFLVLAEPLVMRFGFYTSNFHEKINYYTDVYTT